MECENCQNYNDIFGEAACMACTDHDRYEPKESEGKKMKTYKTWEIWRDAGKLEDRHFKCIKSYNGAVQQGSTLRLIHFANCPGLAKENEVGGKRINGLTGFEEWELVQESATFMEAANSGRRVRPINGEYPDYEYISYWVRQFPSMVITNFLEILNGIWYIE